MSQVKAELSERLLDELQANWCIDYKGFGV